MLNSSDFDDTRKRSVTLRGDDGGEHAISGMEAMLDIEYITSLGANISAEFWGLWKRVSTGRPPARSQETATRPPDEQWTSASLKSGFEDSRWRARPLR